MCGGRRFAVQQLLHHELGVANAAGQLLTAAELLQQRQLVGAEVSLLVDVGHCAHQRTQDQLGVVLAERKTWVRCLRHGKKLLYCARPFKEAGGRRRAAFGV